MVACPLTASVTFQSFVTESHPQGLTPSSLPNSNELDFNNDGRIDLFVMASQSTGFRFASANNSEIYAIEYPPDSRDLGSFSVPLDLGASIGAIPEGSAVWRNEPIGALIHHSALLNDTVFSLGLWPFGIHYLGARFEIAGDWHYGWVEVDSWTGVNTGFIRGYAYETQPGVPIFAGSVPEPGRVALLMLAWLGWSLRRRRGGVA